MGKRQQDYEHQPLGFYPTPIRAFTPLPPHLDRGGRYADPCAGDGALCEHLARAGFVVAWAMDLAPRDRRILRGDAMALTAAHDATAFVTNPPWPERGRRGEPALSILQRLATLAPTWALLPADFMHTYYGAEPMRFCRHVVTVGRIRWIPDTANDGVDNCAWYLFDGREPSRSLRFTGRSRQARVDALRA
jgi:hypothetical protein